MARRFVARLGLLGALLAACQVAAYLAIVNRTVPEEIRRSEDYLDRGVDVIYFGDSTVVELARGDTDHRSLAQMVDQRLPGLEVVPIAHYAYHMGLYSAYCDTFRRARHRPRAVLVPVNLRSFSPHWTRKPEWQFEKEKYLLRHPGPVSRAFLRPLAVFRAVELNSVSEEEFANIPLYVGSEQIGTAGELEAQESNPPPGADPDTLHRTQFAYRYQYTLTEANPIMRALAAVAMTLRECGIAPVFYVTPIDYERGTRLCGDAFARQVDANVALIESVLARYGATSIDLSRSIGSDVFCYRQQVHEHLDQEGRAVVAQILARELEAALAAQEEHLSSREPPATGAPTPPLAP
jgi:hypothetical protein